MPGTPYDALFAQYAAIRGIPQALIEAVARTESSLRPNIITPEPGDRNSYGLFQILDSTARGLGFRGDFQELLKPEINTHWATLLMQQIITRQGGLNLNNFYSEYNSGSPTLWQKSEQVFEHVQNFLASYAKSVPLADAGAAGLLIIAIGLLIRYLKRK